MASLEADIDRLYQGPLQEFVSARTALARSLSGDEAKQVKGLQKPAAAAWAVNQTYWHARPVYDRLIKSGAALRSTQIAALGGRKADLRGATETHRKALAEAVKEAQRLARSAGVNPNQDALTQTLEALSLATAAGERPGRLTQPLQPAGFEALAGVAVKEAPAALRSVPARHRDDPRTREREKKEREKEEAAAEAERQRQAEITTAQAALARAQQDEATARSEWETRKRELEEAERTLFRLRKR